MARSNLYGALERARGEVVGYDMPRGDPCSIDNPHRANCRELLFQHNLNTSIHSNSNIARGVAESDAMGCCSGSPIELSM